MKPMTEFRKYWLVLTQLTIGIVVFGAALAVSAADNKYSKQDNRFGASDSRNSRDNDSQPSRARVSVQPKSVPSVQQSAPAGRAIRQEPTRFAPVDTPSNTQRQSSSFGWDRSKSADVRTLVVDGNDRQGNNKRGLDRGAASKIGSDKGVTGGTGDSSPPVRRNIQRDTPPPSTKNFGSSEIRRQTPPSTSQNTGSQLKTSDVRKRLEGASGVSGAGSTQLERRNVTDLKLDKTIAPRDSTSSPPISNQGDRTKASDVRKRLDSGSGSLPIGSSGQDRRSSDTLRKLDKGITTPDIKSPLSLQGDRTKTDDVRRRLSGGKGGDDAAKTLDRRIGGTKSPAEGVIKSGPTKLTPPGGFKPMDKSSGITGLQGKATRDRTKPRFSDQVKSGELNRLTAGQTAKNIKLADQYKMHQQGDVARRLDLQKHGEAVAKQNYVANLERFRHGVNPHHNYVYHPNFYHGVVSPAYAQHCLQYRYWGPTFFAGLCWYPQWNPWVAWSWNHHCHPYWDPRPIWCRPVIYDPCPVWVYWETPVWTPLPVATCGTWVDLRPVIVAAAESDLQLVAVRFVDPGHPEEKLGPRYRVWLRNNSRQPITRPFNVALFASNDGRLVAGLPQAGVRVKAIEAGDIQSVDIRLPAEVLAMNRDTQGNPAPFAALHALVDANQEIIEIVRTNNGARLTPAEILPIDPAAFDVDPVSTRPGGEVVLAGEGLGPEPGQLLVHVGGQELQGEILGWYDLGVRWSVPKLTITAPTEAEVIVIRGDGAATNPLKITINP